MILARCCFRGWKDTVASMAGMSYIQPYHLNSDLLEPESTWSSCRYGDDFCGDGCIGTCNVIAQ